MAENPISEALQSDHLFLLVGANALPNWVAARLLLREDGEVYLVHSKETIEVARRLAKVLIAQKYRQPIYVPVFDASSPHEVSRTVAQHAKAIKSGQIGLNYTGGNKVMSVHGYFAIKNEHASGLPPPIFSYLDALTLKMYFDDGRDPIFVGSATRAGLTLKELLAFHDVVGMQEPKREPIAFPVVEALKELHRHDDHYSKWRKWITRLQQDPEAPNKNLEWPEEFLPVAIALAKGRPLSSTTCEKLCREKVWPPFKQAMELINWMEGKWRESYVLDWLEKISRRHSHFHLHDYGLDFTIDLASKTGRFKFQVDVAAMRGYQLHFISCYAGHHKQTSKYHLFEAFVRARQIGGDEAGAALVCMSEEPKDIEYDVAQVLQAEGRVKVFGRRELQDLEKHLAEWFQTGIPSS